MLSALVLLIGVTVAWLHILSFNQGYDFQIKDTSRPGAQSELQKLGVAVHALKLNQGVVAGLTKARLIKNSNKYYCR